MVTATQVGTAVDTASVQRRTLRLLFSTQTIGGVGVAIGLSVGALLAAEMAGVRLSGLAQSVAVVGAALLAVPATRIMRQYGRGPGLAASYTTAALGAVLVVTAAVVGAAPLLFLGLFLFGGGTTANSLSRYAAVDLAPENRRGRHLSLIVWATTLGAVAGPNLAPLAGRALDGYGIPTLAAPFAFSAGLFLAGAVLVVALLRPDPLLVARSLSASAVAGGARDEDSRAGAGAAARVADGPDSGSAVGTAASPDAAGGAPDAAGGADPGPAGEGQRGAGMRQALTEILARPAARLGAGAMAVGHLVMVSVMAMTPVHIREAGHSDAHTLRIVGIVLSLHIAGMYAFAPVTGWLTDRYGRRVILGGLVLLLAACAVAGTAGHDSTQLTAGLFLLGLGWSGTMVAGSALLSESVPLPVRPSAQGLADVGMGLAGAVGGAASGLVVDLAGYPTLTLLAAVAATPLLALALRPVRERVYA
jgi:MFS family permease